MSFEQLTNMSTSPLFSIDRGDMSTARFIPSRGANFFAIFMMRILAESYWHQYERKEASALTITRPLPRRGMTVCVQQHGISPEIAYYTRGMDILACLIVRRPRERIICGPSSAPRHDGDTEVLQIVPTLGPL